MIKMNPKKIGGYLSVAFYSLVLVTMIVIVKDIFYIIQSFDRKVLFSIVENNPGAYRMLVMNLCVTLLVIGSTAILMVSLAKKKNTNIIKTIFSVLSIIYLVFYLYVVNEYRYF